MASVVEVCDDEGRVTARDLGDEVRVTSALALRRPIYCVAPMVGQCDLPFRLLCRRQGATLVYTEMFLARRFATEARYRMDALGGGVDAADRPLFVQFASNDAAEFAEACDHARALGADGADLNLGCPQIRAKEGRYGAWLQEDWDTCCGLVAAARRRCPETFSISVKLRVQYDEDGGKPSPERTVAFAKRLVAAGATLVALHARTRGRVDARRDGAADLAVVKRLVEANLGVPVLSNGNVRCRGDVAANLEETGADGLMVAEQLLRDPALFSEDGDRPTSPAALVGAYLDACAATEARRGVPRDDGSTAGRDGAVSRAESPQDGAARYSNWWPNVDVVRCHVKRLLEPAGAAHKETLQRNTFRKALSVANVDAYLRKRLRLPDFDAAAARPPEASQP